ncbi:MAG: hypothetical protein MZV65_13550 [Chromatiales bacterium]|nr:hypothetical protein [Chromatiales bacterium]
MPKLSAYSTELGQHEGLYRAYRQIADGPEYARLDPAQRKVIDNALRDFRLVRHRPAAGTAIPLQGHTAGVGATQCQVRRKRAGRHPGVDQTTQR